MKPQRSNLAKREVLPSLPSALWITRIPRVGLTELQAAIDDAIWWQQHQPITQEDRIAKDEALVRLLQARWHVNDAMAKQDQAA